MSNFKLAVLKASEVLSNKRMGPLRLSQIIRLPLGDLHIVTVGIVEKGILPTIKDLKVVGAQISKLVKKMKDFSDRKYETLIFPPIIEVKQLFLEGGTLYIFLLGDLDHGIMPSVNDLKNAMDLVVPMMKRLGLKNPPAIFFPPIIKTSVVQGALAVTLGDIDKGINPSRKDGQMMKQVLKYACGLVGVKNVIVIPAHGSWAKTFKAKKKPKTSASTRP
jgi:hypothetical protein